MKKYLAYFRANLQELFEYRGDITIYTLQGMVAPLVGLAVWLTVSSSGTQLAYSRNQIILYFLLVAWVELFTSSWSSWFINGDINSGRFSRYLLKPFSVFEDHLIGNLSEKGYKIVIVTILGLILGFILLREDAFTLNPNFFYILLLIPSLIMALMINFLIDLIIGLSTFWFHEVDFLNSCFSLMKAIFGGKIVPLIFLPAFLSGPSTYLPFRYTLSFPIEILLGKTSPSSILIGFLIQVSWLIVFIVLYKIVYAKGLRLYQGYGL